MPPRYVYWTILIDGKATAFRAHEREELLPIFNQLARKSPDIAMKYFAKGKLWDTPEQAQWASTSLPRSSEGRNREWRPGGEHKDPRARFKTKSKETQRRSQAPGVEPVDEADVIAPPLQGDTPARTAEQAPGTRETPTPVANRPKGAGTWSGKSRKPFSERPKVKDAATPAGAEGESREPFNDRPKPAGTWRDRPKTGGWQNREGKAGSARTPLTDRPKTSGDWRPPSADRDRAKPSGGWSDRPKPAGAWRDKSKSDWQPREGGSSSTRTPFTGRPKPAGAWRDKPKGDWQTREGGRGDTRKPFTDRPKAAGGWSDRPKSSDAPRGDTARRDTRKPFSDRPKTSGDWRPPSGDRGHAKPVGTWRDRPKTGDAPRGESGRNEARKPFSDRPKPAGGWSDRPKTGGWSKDRPVRRDSGRRPDKPRKPR